MWLCAEIQLIISLKLIFFVIILFLLIHGKSEVPFWLGEIVSYGSNKFFLVLFCK